MDLGGGDDTANTGGGFMNVNLGGSGADNLTSQGVLDFVLGGSGDDTITATGYFAIVRGGSGDDTIYGADRSGTVDFLYGDDGADTIYGRAGTDYIYGGEGADTIDGGAGDDKIVGGAGDDTLTGGTGADTFYFWEGHGTDTIKDFSTADGDKINLIAFDKTITWDQVSAKITTVTDPNDDTVVTGVQIDLSDWGGGTVILDGITSVSDLTEDMFVLNRLVGTDEEDDELVGGDSDDTMTGGKGADTFFFLESSGDDTITDFSTTEGDKIDLDRVRRLDHLGATAGGDDGRRGRYLHDRCRRIRHKDRSQRLRRRHDHLAGRHVVRPDRGHVRSRHAPRRRRRGRSDRRRHQRRHDVGRDRRRYLLLLRGTRRRHDHRLQHHRGRRDRPDQPGRDDHLGGAAVGDDGPSRTIPRRPMSTNRERRSTSATSAAAPSRCGASRPPT